MYAAKSSSRDIVKDLVKMKANGAALDEEKRNAISHAAQTIDPFALEYLVRRCPTEANTSDINN